MGPHRRRSDERLDYDRVDRIFAGAEPARDPWAAPLDAARSAARELARERERRGALAIVSGEPEFAFDRDGHIVEIRLGEQTESHRLIEHLMIAANEQVAKLLDQRGLPGLYRVHEQPDPSRVDRLVAQLASLEVPTPPMPKTIGPTQAGELVGEISQAVDRYVRASGRGRAALTSLVLRSLKQAYYSPRNLGHAGLRSTAYCHFTSPIRRYPDLVCHRSLLAAVGAAREGGGPEGGAGLAELADWTSSREREAMEIERSADDVARCFALAREDPDREWEGEIVGLIGAGAFVAFGPPRDPERGSPAAGGPGRGPGRRDRGPPGPGGSRARVGPTGVGWVACSRRLDVTWPRASARSRRATSPPTGTPPTGTTCSSGSSAGSSFRGPRSSPCEPGAPS
ncbi:MAG: RNB domain-containing ribonuclease [Actinobacteria bacterium]|nr:RNB domain-containing ribonuclease [Actinomycetota bacterium]